MNNPAFSLSEGPNDSWDVESLFGDKLAAADLALANVSPILRYQLGNDDHALISDRVVAQVRAQQLLDQERLPILLDIVGPRDQMRIAFSSADQTAPQSLSFALTTPSGINELTAYLGRLRPTHCEIIDAANMPAPFTRILKRLDIHYDVWVADGTLLLPVAGATTTPTQSESSRAFPSVKRISPIAPLNGEPELSKLMSAARSILAPCAASMALASRTRIQKTKLQPLPVDPLNLGAVDTRRSGLATCLAIVPTSASAKVFEIIRALARALQKRAFNIQILVAGATFDDLLLMTHANVFVTGPIKNDELPLVLAPHNVNWVLTGLDRPIFGHSMISSVRAANRPVAFVDWTNGSTATRPGDLAIPPALSVDQFADHVASWLEGDSQYSKVGVGG